MTARLSALSSSSHALTYVQTVRLYDVEANEQKLKFDHRAAVLACAFADNDRAFSGGLDTSVKECVIIPSFEFLLSGVFNRLDLNTEKANHLGQHSDSISSMNYSRDLSEEIHSLYRSGLSYHTL